ncbi:MAG: hypothetical protein FJ257_11410 [Phycisphaerae bacterium]|nr:hypothetical protein [Phycisphaerae bacterium]
MNMPKRASRHHAMRSSRVACQRSSSTTSLATTSGGGSTVARGVVAPPVITAGSARTIASGIAVTVRRAMEVPVMVAAYWEQPALSLPGRGSRRVCSGLSETASRPPRGRCLRAVRACPRSIVRACPRSPRTIAPSATAPGLCLSTTAVQKTGVGGLAPRERKVALALADGLSRAHVAERMALSVHTVATIARRVYRKIGVSSQAGLAARLAGHARRELGER